MTSAEKKHKLPYPLVLVEWLDSESSHRGWQKIDDFDDDIRPCLSVGFLIKKTKKVVLIFAHLDANRPHAHGQGEMCIPRCAITKLKTIKG